MTKPGERLLPTALFLLLASWKAQGDGLETRIDAALQRLSRHVSTAPAEIDPAILQHPLFVPGRRPLERTGDALRKEPRQSREKPVLKAVIQERRRTYALISLGDRSLRAVSVGDLLDGARVIRILPDRLVLQRDGGRRTLHLYRYPPARPGRGQPSSSGDTKPDPATGAAGNKKKPGDEP